MSENRERQERILAAAAELFVHYGYDKTTVDDIAREAGVSKGAIYLHFKSKDELFETLLVSEMQTYAEKWLELIDADPKGGTLAAMYKNSLYALNSSAFMAAMFKQDSRVLGNYLRKPDNFFRVMRDAQQESERYVFVKMMQDAGALRKDMDAKVIAHIMDMLAYSLVGIDDVLPNQDKPPTEDIIEGIAEIMDRALTPEGGGDSEAGKAILQQIAEASRQQLGIMKEAEQE
ncbi:MAG: TetR family transcriptional regulator [Chloroflexi bacterium]|nr:MAG: TetR family transcriptional regulator [Chloroflexota bacterium]MBL1194117.1 TetR family transcriptional regulator [Chloroflexota bacterium]NOH11410.1 TetR/AcrR family transcriptional regulator [Chloroflexota bacterium]